MNVRLAVAAIVVPVVLRRRGLAELAQRTARAFEVEAPSLAGMPFREALGRYAVFAREQADRAAVSSATAARAREQLRREAVEFGAGLRRSLRVRSRAEAVQVARILYRALGMDLKASLTGSIVVRSCFFSSTYTCGTCAIMSAMDEGLFAGLAGEGHLEFTMRITEGAPHCAAFFTFEEERHG